jgi:hypothetical protein
MRTPIKKAIAAFGGAAAVAMTAGFGVAGVSWTAGASTVTTPSSSNVTPAQPGAAVPGVHIATLSGCIVGANC